MTTATRHLIYAVFFSKSISEYTSHPKNASVNGFLIWAVSSISCGLFLLVGSYNSYSVGPNCILNSYQQWLTTMNLILIAKILATADPNSLASTFLLIVVIKIHHGHQCQAIPVPSATCTGVVIFSKCSPLKWNLWCTGLRVLACLESSMRGWCTPETLKNINHSNYSHYIVFPRGNQLPCRNFKALLWAPHVLNRFE